MLDKIFYQIFELLDKFVNWIYDRFICDKPKKK
jgi:hypothetical protein